MSHPTDHRLSRFNAPSVNHQRNPDELPNALKLPENVVLNCGWGQLIMAHTFKAAEEVARVLSQESQGQRDIAFYVRDPHVVLAHAPQSLFLDPSHTYRLWLNQYRSADTAPRSYSIRRLRTRADAAGINRVYALRRMVPVEAEFVWLGRTSRQLSFIVAEDHHSGEIIGSVMGVDHVHTFGDPEGGSSLWCLAVDPQCPHPGVGEALVRYLIEQFLARGRAFLDLSVMHDNQHAIALYEKLGFQRVPVFTIKRKNAINESLYTGPDLEKGLNPYARLLTKEARRRGIHVEILDVLQNYFRLSLGGRSVICRESLTELTSAIAMSRCQDKSVTTRLLRE